jgi:hypothetical protein
VQTKLPGPYEGKIGLQDLGVAQGGLIDDTKGNCILSFRDYGAVGPHSYLVPVKWEDGWRCVGGKWQSA